MDRIDTGALSVVRVLHDFVTNEALPGTGIAAPAFWQGLAEVIRDLAPKNQKLLAERDALQAKLDAFHRRTRNSPHDPAG